MQKFGAKSQKVTEISKFVELRFCNTWTKHFFHTYILMDPKFRAKSRKLSEISGFQNFVKWRFRHTLRILKWSFFRSRSHILDLILFLYVLLIMFSNLGCMTNFEHFYF